MGKQKNKSDTAGFTDSVRRFILQYALLVKNNHCRIVGYDFDTYRCMISGNRENKRQLLNAVVEFCETLVDAYFVNIVSLAVDICDCVITNIDLTGGTISYNGKRHSKRRCDDLIKSMIGSHLK
jgi:hypothetical protein